MIWTTVFGGGRNVVKETAEVFRVNTEAQAGRDSDRYHAALQQFGAEFLSPRKGWFDRFVDALNRLPRPFMAIGVIALFVSAMFNPVWFGERMVGIALVPEPLWWLLGVVVSFYFGARFQSKGQEFEKSIVRTVALAPTVVRNVQALRDLDDEDDYGEDGNAVLDDWHKTR